ncbi:MAG: Gfo/Idh/MocA family oxidoreductase [Gemmatimonadetes bacterium]|nr:Gfo/Idh/MocA family oxidoreductase [Gemmatimonadota bacterium]MDA1102309.1 Gfo/Idh/MocA family oxidoreductase [Gemmatimonadota bacterium]
MAERLRVGVIGAGRWSRTAHLPGFMRSPLCDLVAICDLDEEAAASAAAEFGATDVMTDAAELLRRDDIDVVDVVTRGDHQDLVFATLEAGKHCLVEKPVCHDFRDVWRAHELARSKGLKTKVGLTFRYAPAVMYMFDLIRQGFIGEPYVFNGYEQNSQWLDPDNPMDKRIHKVKPVGEPAWGTDLSPAGITVSSLEGYGAPTIDIGLECIGGDLVEVVGRMANMVPFRRKTNLDSERERINIDDADMFIGQAANGALFSMQSSYVTVGNYPGIEARIYGSEGAIQVRLVEEFGVIQTIHTAKPDAVEFVQQEIPAEYFPPGYQAGDHWGTAFYGNLVHNFCQEIVDGGDTNQGDFAQSARVQEVINAVAQSHRERRWIDLPLSDAADAGQQSPH